MEYRFSKAERLLRGPVHEGRLGASMCEIQMGILLSEFSFFSFFPGGTVSCNRVADDLLQGI